MNHLRIFFRYLNYFFTAKSADSIHSPFVFDLYVNLITDSTPFYVFDRIEDLRLVLENDRRLVQMIDFGTKRSGLKKIKSIAKNSSTRAKYGQLLFRLVNKFHPHTILEIGTSLGLGTLYLASPDSRAKVITLEGSAEISGIAKTNFDRLNLKNIEQVTGNFDDMLPLVLKKIAGTGSRPDFVFFDGNHRKEPTLRYFEQCLVKSHGETIFILDDIHWSDEMEEAWDEIKKRPEVRVTIDLFFFGLVFFRKELTKQDFVLRF